MAHKVYIVEDHPVMRDGYKALIAQDSDLIFSGEASTAVDALSDIAKTKPDVVLIDIALPGQNGLELTKRLKALYPHLSLLVISAHDELLYAERALRAGASGYLMKREAAESIVRGIRTVLSGELYLSTAIRSRLLRAFLHRPTDEQPQSPLDVLTDRELEVLDLIGRGLRTRDIADALMLSVKTIESHRSNIVKKLGFENSTELMRYAILRHETTPDEEAPKPPSAS